MFRKMDPVRGQRLREFVLGNSSKESIIQQTLYGPMDKKVLYIDCIVNRGYHTFLKRRRNLCFLQLSRPNPKLRAMLGIHMGRNVQRMRNQLCLLFSSSSLSSASLSSSLFGGLNVCSKTSPLPLGLLKSDPPSASNAR